MSQRSEEMKFPEPPEALRESLLATTLRRVKRRVYRRRALILCAVAGAYALGAFTMTSPPATPATPPVQTAAQPHTPPEAETAQANDTLGPAERKALMASRQTPEQRREALRAAGNRCLDEFGDIARATELYGRFLDKAPSEELRRFDPNDTWLLRALRCARLQENVHESESI